LKNEQCKNSYKKKAVLVYHQQDKENNVNIFHLNLLFCLRKYKTILMLQVIIDELRLKSVEGRLLLKKINFSISKNQVFAVLGNNGSGKSTLLKTIPRLLDNRFYSFTGRILLDGTDILSLDQRGLEEVRKNRLKYIMQDSANSFDPLKKFRYYFEMVAETHNSALSEAQELLKYFMLPGTDKLYKLYPYEVSSGMAQRLSFILAFISHPKVLLLDEPTSGVDSPIINLLLLKLKEFAATGDNIVLLVTHDLLFAEKISDKIALLSDGSLSEFCSPEEFRLNNSRLIQISSGEGINA
jgi:ABC-type glutathione transport system ATPase component